MLQSYLSQLEAMSERLNVSIPEGCRAAAVCTSAYYRAVHGVSMGYPVASRIADGMMKAATEKQNAHANAKDAPLPAR